MCLAVIDLCLTGIHLPFVITPGSNDLNVGSQCLDAKLETDLVISLSGRTVTDGNCVFFSGDLNQLLCDTGTCHGGSQQIFVLVNSAAHDAGNDVVLCEFIGDVLNVQFGSTGELCALLQSVQLFLLSAVDAAADDFVIIGFL